MICLYNGSATGYKTWKSGKAAENNVIFSSDIQQLSLKGNVSQ
jgi:hypothetical protein